MPSRRRGPRAGERACAGPSRSKSRLRAAARPSDAPWHGRGFCSGLFCTVRSSAAWRNFLHPRLQLRAAARSRSANARAKASTSCRGRSASCQDLILRRGGAERASVIKIRRRPSLGISLAALGPSPSWCPSCRRRPSRISAGRASSSWRMQRRQRPRTCGAGPGGRVEREIPLIRGFSARVPRGACARCADSGVRSVHADHRFVLRSTTDAPATPSTTLDRCAPPSAPTSVSGRAADVA